MSSLKPTYDLLQIKKILCDSASVYITTVAFRGAVELGYMDEEAIISVLEDLGNEDFYKTMPAEKIPGFWQDVYHFCDGQNKIYIKLQLSPDGKKVVVVAFKRK